MRLLIPVLLIAACVAAPPADERPAPGGPDCHLPYERLVGTPIAAVTLPDNLNHRIIRPGDAITMDFSPSRVNFDLDASGTIARVWCG